MAKKRNTARNATIIAVLSILILSIVGSVLYFNKQTIFGLKSSYNIGDQVQFDAIATNFDNRDCQATVTIEKPDGTIVTVAKNIPLPNSCIGAPCQTIKFIVGDPAGQRKLKVSYTCSSIIDFKTFNVVKPSVLACSDSDGGKIISKKGTVSGLDDNGNKYSYSDSCVNENSVKEWTCQSNYPVGSILDCASGSVCQDGACVSKEEDGMLVCTQNQADCTWGLYKEFSTKPTQYIGKCDETYNGNKEPASECNEEGICTEGDMQNLRCDNNDVKFKKCEDGEWSNVVQVCLGEQICDEEKFECSLEGEIVTDKAKETESIDESEAPSEKETPKAEECTESQKTDEKGECVFDWEKFWKNYGVVVGIGALILLIVVSIVISQIYKED